MRNLHSICKNQGNVSAGRSVQQLLMIMLLATLLSGCDFTQQHKPAAAAPAVTIADVIVKPIRQWDTFNGRIEAVQSVQLRPRVSGYISRVNYTEGEVVKKGQLLFTIDDRTYRAALGQAQAELAHARSQAALARNESTRTDKLIASHVISTELWEQRRSAASQAQAEVLSAESSVALAQLNLDFTRVTAPIEGRASRALMTEGNLVTAGDSASVLTSLVAVDHMYVYFDVDEDTFLHYQELARIARSASTTTNTQLPVMLALTGEQGYTHQGIVNFTDNQLNPDTGTIRMRALLDNRDSDFTPGLFARVKMPASNEFTAMLIDDKSVMTDQDRKFVYIVDHDGRAQRRDIEPGREAEGMRIVTKGLSAGDRVMIAGMQKVFKPGIAVNAEVARLPKLNGSSAATALNSATAE